MPTKRKRPNTSKDHSLIPSAWTDFMSRAAMFLAALAVIYYVYTIFISEETSPSEEEEEVVVDVPDEENDDANNQEVLSTLKNYLPKSAHSELVRHQYFSLGYAEKHEQAEWVAYELTRENLNGKRVERSGDFRSDPEVKTGSATPADYKNSGYDRGHLCAAADMGFAEAAMRETFFMSNMSPQLRNFNCGVWRELEENVRDWARGNKKLYVVTGPVLTIKSNKYIGRDNQVTVPKAYYKALLDLTDPEQKAIAFLIPNERRSEHLHDFAMSIDSLEKITQIDFFPALPNKQEAKLESNMNPFRWPTDEERFQQRLSKWNYE